MPVAYVHSQNRMYESTFASRNAFQTFQGRSVRCIDDLDYHRIRDAAGLTGAPWHAAPTEDEVISSLLVPGGATEPRAICSRPLTVIPDGTGYRRTGKTIDIFEVASLQKRARGDHQDTLKLVKAMVQRRNGRCLFNNNVDSASIIR